MTHTVSIRGYTAMPNQLQLGTVDSYGVEDLQLKFDDIWAGLAVTATFTAPNGTSIDKVVGMDGTVEVPHEATCNGAGQGVIVLRGCRDGLQIISCNIHFFTKKHGPVNGTAAVDPTPDKWQQFVDEVQDDREAAETAKQNAENAAKKAVEAKTGADNALKDAGVAKEAASNYADAAADSATAAATSETNAANSASAAADSAAAAAQTKAEVGTLGDEKKQALQDEGTAQQAAIEKKGQATLATIPENYTQTVQEVSQLKEEKLDKPDNPVVGQILRVKSIDETGKIVLETVAGGGSGLPEGGTAGQVLAKKTDASGDAEWTDKAVVLTTPLTQTQDELISLMQNGPLYVYNNGLLYTVSRLANNVLSGYGPIIYSGKTYAIQSCVIAKGIFSLNPYIFIGISAGGSTGQILAKKSATNGDTQWVDPQTATVRTAMDDVAVAGAKYFLGEQTELSITMPDDAAVGQEIMVVFSSGKTACTLAVDLDDFDFVPKANSMCKIVFLCVGTETWLVDAKEG